MLLRIKCNKNAIFARFFILKSTYRTGKWGYPEYVAVINDFVLVIEDKAEVSFHIKYTDIEGLLFFCQKWFIKMALFNHL